MAPKSPTPKSNDLFRQRLDELVNLRHPLAQLAGHIDWSVFEHEWAGLFPSRRGRPATAPRLIAGLLYLQHTYALSDEDVVWGWVENPYWQLFCGETWFQHHPPIDPSSLTRWRKRIGEEGLEWLLTQTIRAAQSVGVVKRQSFDKVIVDSTVQEKAIAHPTDSKLLNRGREQLVKLASEAGITLRQNYNREAPRLAGQIGRYAHAKQYKRKEGLVIGMRSLPGNPYDGHTLPEAIEQVSILTAQKPKAVFVDKGYRGVSADGVTIWRSGQKRGVTPSIRKAIHRRSAVEPAIGHMKNEGKLRRNWLKGSLGDALNAVLCGAGHNLRMILRAIRLFYVWTLCSSMVDTKCQQSPNLEFRYLAAL